MSYCPISTTSEWTHALLIKYETEIARVAENFKLETYPNQIEIISAEQMMDAYSSIGMPVGYSHWSFGKQFLNIEKQYQRGQMGLAYELVINSNPCIAYLLEENTLPMQALVIAHACYGHNSFFKNNYLFKTWTTADSIVDYLVFAKNYIRECEERFGVSEVEETLDACHALMTQGVDRYQRPNPISLGEEQIRQEKRADYLQTLVNDLWRTIPKVKNNESIDTTTRFPTEPQENVLYFLEKNAPLLASWQREIIRIVRKMAQYFYPQRQTKVMNEGWATFWHYQIIYQLYTEQLLTEQFMLEFLHTHTNVIYQPKYDSSYYSGLNPYTLGFNMFMDLKRICEAPTAEDKHWFPDIANSNWITTLDFAMRNFKDDSFIAQFLSPKLIRDMKLFSILDDEQKNHLQITSIHNEDGYQIIRQQLAENYNIGKIDPDIQIFDINHRGDRTLTLRYTQHNARPLALKSATQVMKHLYKLWGFPIKLETVNISGKLLHTEHCPATPKISNS